MSMEVEGRDDVVIDLQTQGNFYLDLRRNRRCEKHTYCYQRRC